MKTALLTTGEVATHCRVSYETVNQWIKAGKLKSYTTPGRHHRIQVEDFRKFIAEHHLPPLAAPRVDRFKILIVDDEPSIVQMMTKELTRTAEYEVATAADGFEAGIQVARFQPDLIILDLIMPHMDGFKVCQQIKSDPETQQIAILVITGYPTDENLQRALECGADYCLAKPLQLPELNKRVDALLSRDKTALLSQTA